MGDVNLGRHLDGSRAGQCGVDRGRICGNRSGGAGPAASTSASSTSLTFHSRRDDLDAHSLRILDVESGVQIFLRSDAERFELRGHTLAVEVLYADGEMIDDRRRVLVVQRDDDLACAQTRYL